MKAKTLAVIALSICIAACVGIAAYLLVNGLEGWDLFLLIAIFLAGFIYDTVHAQ